MSWSRLDTLRNRLVLLIFAITAGAIAFVYLYVVPQLEASLTAEKLRRLERLGSEQGPRLTRSLDAGAAEPGIEDVVRSISQVTDSRVTLIAARDEAGSFAPEFVVADSQGEPSAIQGSYLAAATALEADRISSGVETVAGERVGASAVPIETGDGTRWVAVLSSPLDDVDDNVALIR